jgi:flavin reductase (DIM6/NTAB) family NADH-FMN oxidoreductase RutF
MEGDAVRALMRRFPAGVAVVTVDAGGERLGLTVGTFLPLSLEPPLVGISIAREAALHELLREAGGFAVSLLSAGQEAVAQHFARGVPPIAHWHGISFRDGVLGAPLLEGALGWVECRVWAEWPAGDHTVFAGEVVEFELGPAQAPLLYLDRRYRAL